jgi:hypothetical protein
MEYHITQLRTPRDLQVLMEYAQRSGDGVFVNRVHGILGDALVAFMESSMEEIDRLRGMSLGMLIQQADRVGFWNLSVLPGVATQNGISSVEGLTLGVGVMDRYATPPAQILHQYR